MVLAWRELVMADRLIYLYYSFFGLIIWFFLGLNAKSMQTIVYWNCVLINLPFGVVMTIR